MFDWIYAGIAVAGVSGAWKAGSAVQNAANKAGRKLAAAEQKTREKLLQARVIRCPSGHHDDEWLRDDGNSGRLKCRACGREVEVCS